MKNICRIGNLKLIGKDIEYSFKELDGNGLKQNLTDGVNCGKELEFYFQRRIQEKTFGLD